MADFVELVIGVDTRGLKKGERALDDTTRAGRKTERAVDKTGDAFTVAGAKSRASTSMMSDGMKRATAAAVLLSVAVIGTASLRAAEQYAKMTNGLKAMGASSSEAAMQLNAISDIALRTRAPLDATVQLYTRISIAADELGASQQEVLRFTENVGLALGAAGIGANEASGALMQLSQAMSGGVVRAEEFNSIMENAYPLALAAAEGIDAAGGSVGKLRQLVVDGKVSSEEFFDAILLQGDALAETFDKTNITMSQATENMQTAFTKLIGTFDQITGGTSAIASGIDFLAQNLDAVTGLVIAATGAIVIGFTPAIIGATVAAATFVVGLVTLKGALLATGIGAVVVIAGVLIGKFLELVRGTGSFGEAFKAVAVLSRAAVTDIGTFLAGLLAVSQSVAAGFSATFLQAFASVLDSGFDFVDSFITGPLNSLERALGLDLQTPLRRKVSDGLRKMSLEYTATAQEASATARQLFASTTATSTAFEEFTTKIAETAEEVNAAAVASKLLDNSLTSTGKSAGKTVPKIEELKTETEAFNAAMEEAAMTTEDLGKAKAQILVSGIDSMAGAFGDFVSGGLKDFKSFASSIVDTFKRMLSQMIAMAVKNKIMISLGMGGGGGGNAASMAMQAAGGGGGVAGAAGAALGGLGSLGSVFMNGASASLSAFSGGISAGIGQVGATMAGATASLPAFAAAVGAVAVPLLAVVAVFAFFKKKTKELDAGVRLTVKGLNVMVESFKKVQTSRFFGLSKKVRTTFTSLGAAANPLKQTIRAIQTSVLTAAASIGVGAGQFAKFSKRIKISTKGLSDKQAQKAVTDALNGFSDEFANMVRGLSKFAIAGEGASDTLSRLSASLLTVNDVFRDLGFGAYNVSLAGAGAASQFAQLFGSLQNFTASTGAYYDQFFTNDEKMANATARLTQSLAALGIDFVPQTKSAFRDLVDTAMLGGDSDLAAQLIMLAPAFSAVTDATNRLADAIDAMNTNENAFATGVDFRRGLSRAANNIAYSPEKSQAEMLAELKSLNARMDVLQSTSEITANSSSQTAENTDYTNALTLEAAT